MKVNTKPKCIYIKNIYIQPSKNQKLNNSLNIFSKTKKQIPEYHDNIKGINYIPKQINKTSIKSFYQNIYPSKDRYLLKGNPNYLSSKNISNKTNTKYHKQKYISSEKVMGPTISGRKIIHKNYQIINPFKERSNSENSLNCFNRTYTFFNKKDDKNSNLKTKPGNIINISRKDTDKINISCTNNNKKYNDRNDISKNNNIYSYSSKNSSSSSITIKANKKYFYQDPKYKNDNQDITEEQSILYSTLQKEYHNPMSPNINVSGNISKNINISSIASPSSEKDKKDTFNINNKRIKKYIYSDKKKKMRSRQNFKENNPLWKSTSLKENLQKGQIKSINNNNNINNNINNNYHDSKVIENIPNSPSIPSYLSNENNTNTSCGGLNFYSIKDINNNNLDNLLDSSNYFDSNSVFDSYNKEIKKNEINLIKEKDLFDQSAVIIQSVFRGYIAKNKFESLLYNYKDYNKAFEILEELFIKYYNDDKKIFYKYLKENKKNNNNNNSNLIDKNNVNYKSCKMFKIFSMPFTPNSTSQIDAKITKNRYIDLFLHKEIGERFNILKESVDKEKELEKKHKEEIENINNRINELIEENNKLKDINEKNKNKEKKFKELSNENKKKDNIINIRTNDNQNLARKLKIIKEKNYKLEIRNEINENINIDNNKTNQYTIVKELFINYRNIYLLYLINKKNNYIIDILRKYFDRYKNITINISDNIQLNNTLREEKLKNIITNRKNKANTITYNNITKLYYNTLLNNKDTENIKNLRSEKIYNIFKNKEKSNQSKLKSYFNKFYYKGIISELNENIEDYNKKEKFSKMKDFKKLIISIENHKNKYNFLKIKNCFDRWTLMARMLAMKAVTDEKKRKKRQKQRTKKKIEKNKSANKYLCNSTNNKIINLEKNNIITYNKEKEKEKDVYNYLEHTLTTDFSGGELGVDNKTDKVIKATEKLSSLFYKGALYYKLLENKNNNINFNKENSINININNEKNENIKNNEKKVEDNNNEEEEDSGDSSFGL